MVIMLKSDDNSSSPNSLNQILPVGFVMPIQKLNKEEMDRRRKLELNNLISKKKLYLVLDLDHTLLHSISPEKLTSTEEYVLNQGVCNDSLFRSDKWITKLRPFVRNFLEEASRLFELCVYTMGPRSYAKRMVKFLDPDGKYFKSRVISREDNSEEGKKGLDVVMAPESVVVIVDDTESVWEKHKSNLIVIDGYRYFVGSKKHRTSRVGKLKEGIETDVELVLVLNKLKAIHQRFFDDPSVRKDVRNAFKEVWEDVDGAQPMDSA
ncbi:protein-serine/threonine phosphatase [Ranunculus cassubicifolius]